MPPLHWRLHPESKPKGKTEEEAWFDDLADRRWGASTQEEWQTWARILGVEEKIKDLGAFYTNAHVDEVNRFDPKQILADARAAGR